MMTLMYLMLCSPTAWFHGNDGKRDDRYSTLQLQCQNPTKPNHIVNEQKLLTKY